jgi:hypothetical protein
MPPISLAGQITYSGSVPRRRFQSPRCDDSSFAQQRFDLSDRLLAELDLDAELLSKFFQDHLPHDKLVLL